VAGSNDHNNERSGSTKGRQFLDYVNVSFSRTLLLLSDLLLVIGHQYVTCYDDM
jgi:hypothetical protein